eukprot:CAMPEP_0180655386 /NCGR_PEP_ID=MMETSP1037_2-20121125/55240_1 /TAXON_ID=632150 /ORGANISM="Azadinium spinosum, Strain 3D9" /LENGTH=31 /DNA_ID= /DNA_START= /DNA_END= /DNA_ORIENTATION=
MAFKLATTFSGSGSVTSMSTCEASAATAPPA